MVSPIYIIIILLGASFLLPLFERARRGVGAWMMILALLAAAMIPAGYLYRFAGGTGKTVEVFTAGFRPPLSINLRLGPAEAFLLFAISFASLLGGLYLHEFLEERGARSRSLLLLFTLGFGGIVMTRDIFNLFVFLEVAAISSYVLIALRGTARSLAASFKYAVAGGIASIFMLLGIILLYGVSGTLNIDGMLLFMANNPGTTGALAAFLLLFSLIIENKQFPANGWALDVYQSADPGVSALISVAGSGAVLFAIYKILPLAGEGLREGSAVAGMATFIASNLMGLRQRSATRLLGYSSVGHMGLLLSVISLGFAVEPSASALTLVAGALFINHFTAKAGLYWIAGIVRRDDIRDWRSLASRPALLVPFGLFSVALLGLPPFAGFWAKWELVISLAGRGSYLFIAALLLGSLLEAAYLLRWLGYAAGRGGDERAVEKAGAARLLPVWIFAVIAGVSGLLLGMRILPARHGWLWGPAAALLLALLWKLPEKIKGVLALLMLAAVSYRMIPGLTGFALFFAVFFAGGGLILLAGSLYRGRRSIGYYPLAVAMIVSLIDLASASTLLGFFLAWEIMTLSSYLLILRGADAEKAAYRFIIFSLGGAFMLMTGFAMAEAAAGGSIGIESLGSLASGGPAAFLLIALGMLVKIAAIGLHIWAPDAYTEAEDGVSPLLSGVLSKAGILGLVVLFGRAGSGFLGAGVVYTALGWIGALTAFFATLYAVFQEDAKRLLAWSSVGQVGYILLALAAMNHIGWVAALYHTVNHLLFKGLLFLAVAGVIHRTGTRKMYEMGGLIKRMPLSFISVMIGIIALSGVPPLTGFGGKWLLYNALIERGWYLQTALAFLGGTVAFLYCFRLIHAIFLGQPKTRFRDVKKAPGFLLLPQYILIAAIMILSATPGFFIRYISGVIAPVFPANLAWNGMTAAGPLGYWNPTVVMITVGGVFAAMLIILLLISPRPQKVKQFNIVYAAERPHTPETTHYAYRFFTPYERAAGPLLRPLVRSFWNGVGEWTDTIAGALRQIYTGNAQTYALYIFIFGALLYLISGGAR